MPTANAWSLTSDGRLEIAGKTPESSISYDYTHKSEYAWYMNSQQIISAEAVPASLGWSAPYPYGVWFMQSDSVLHASGMPDRLRWSRPYPATVWYFDEELDHVFNSMIPLELTPPLELPGAFEGCENLHFVRIPKSVKKIGNHAFTGTALECVMISKSCRYSFNSFPQNCEILFYEDMYDINYEEYILGRNNYRRTDTSVSESDEDTSEIP